MLTCFCSLLRCSVDDPAEEGKKIEYRVWNPFRSKIAAAVLGGVDNIWVKPGAKVKKGQAICDVIDPANPNGPKGRTTFTSQTDGVLFSRRLDGYLSWPGQVMYRICGPKPLPHRIGATGLDD